MEDKTDYLETHYEVVKHLVLNEDLYVDKLDRSAQKSKGMGGMWVLAERITDQFQKEYKDETWEEKDWFETLWKFINDFQI